MFRLSFLDHVALRCADVNASAQWYEKVLGLQRLRLNDWPAVPIMMLCGHSGIALFPPANALDTVAPAKACVDHFAFRVERDQLAKARAHFDLLGIAHETQQHPYFESVYLLDPDGHKVELTALVSAEPKLMSYQPGQQHKPATSAPIDAINT